MNYKSIGRFIALILLIEGVFMLPALVLAWCFSEPAAAVAYEKTLLLIVFLGGGLLFVNRGARESFHEREGLVCVGLAWICLSLVGALPLYFSGQIPRFIDALFETVSGFTTTGCSILTDVEALDRSLLYWRSFTHWLGGMGVLVFLLALIPGSSSGFTMHLMRAESPGPSVGKLVPRIGRTARILYMLYIAITLADFVLLLFDGDMPVFDAFCIAVGTAGTGGFSVTNAGLGGYSSYVQIVTTVFMFLFGVNFSCYYLILRGEGKRVRRDEELRWYIGISLAVGLALTVLIRGQYGSLGEALRHSFFQVASLSFTTGFSTVNYETWPLFARGLLLMLTFMGACAGSTCGGLKLSRLLLMFKTIRNNIRSMLHPNRVLQVRNNGEVVDPQVIRNVQVYMTTYSVLLFFSFLLLTAGGGDLVTDFTAALTCLNNVGPGLGAVGPAGNFAAFSDFSKLILIIDMLAGRLELFPILVLLCRDSWREH